MTPSSESASRFGALLTVVLALVVVTAGLAVRSQTVSSGPTCATQWQSDPTTATPVKHLFILVMENHAFENYFGDLPGVLGYPPSGSFPASFGGGGNVSPFPLPGYSTPELPHDAASNLIDYNQGQNNLFVAQAAAMGSAAPADAVGYYTARQLPAYYAYAENYTLGDRFFTGVLGPTFPNRVFDLSANVGNWNADTFPPAQVTDQPTILGELTAHSLPWYYGYAGPPEFLAPRLFPSLALDPCSSTRIAPASGLASELTSSSPPSVVYLDPSNSGMYSEHPPENVTVGEEWSVAAVNTIFESPVASSSAVLIFFDENGGFWDPVPPPMTSTGRDGFRVPFLVLSPWTPAGKVCSETVDPASVLHFIDANWGLPFLTSRVALSSNLSCFFDFAQTPRAPLLLPTPITLGEPQATGSHRAVGAVAAPSPPVPASEPWLLATSPEVREPFWPPTPCSIRQEVEGS